MFSSNQITYSDTLTNFTLVFWIFSRFQQVSATLAFCTNNTAIRKCFFQHYTNFGAEAQGWLNAGGRTPKSGRCTLTRAPHIAPQNSYGFHMWSIFQNRAEDSSVEPLCASGASSEKIYERNQEWLVFTAAELLHCCDDTRRASYSKRRDLFVVWFKGFLLELFVLRDISNIMSNKIIVLLIKLFVIVSILCKEDRTFGETALRENLKQTKLQR